MLPKYFSAVLGSSVFICFLCKYVHILVEGEILQLKNIGSISLIEKVRKR